MNAMPYVLGAIVVFALAYRFYFSFVAARVAVQNDLAVTPANRLYDGQNYYPMNKWVLFGHHFAAIAGAGPLVGPVLAAQFGFFPGFMWMLVGAVMAGAVHDYVILTASVQHDGKSLAEIARAEINKVSGVTTSFAVIIIIIVALAGLGLVVVNALAESSWGTFTIASTIPIAIIMGLWMFKVRKGKIAEATIFGVIMLVLAVVFGRYIPESAVAGWFTFDHKTLTILIAVLWFSRVGTACMAPALATRLPQLNYESNRYRIAGSWSNNCSSRDKNACLYRFWQRRRTYHSREIVSLPFYYNSMRSYFRISFTCQLGDNS